MGAARAPSCDAAASARTSSGGQASWACCPGHEAVHPTQRLLIGTLGGAWLRLGKPSVCSSSSPNWRVLDVSSMAAPGLAVTRYSITYALEGLQNKGMDWVVPGC